MLFHTIVNADHYWPGSKFDDLPPIRRPGHQAPRALVAERLGCFDSRDVTLRPAAQHDNRGAFALKTLEVHLTLCRAESLDRVPQHCPRHLGAMVFEEFLQIGF